MSGRQVAFLAPTTVLAQQHYETLRERMSEYPVRIDILSRYRTAAQQKKTLAGVAAGEVDIVVGTHRLISPDVAWKNLGLLIVDEEQRFGVRQKEQLKERFRLVDVLTLSATPIPRTLYMALMGARDMSVINTPPPNRQPVETVICAYDERLIREAVQRELARGGQVYLLHNRVATIEKLAGRVRELVPGARVETGHGQMPEGELEDVMHRFVAGETDVLVSTTIIESGLDIPNANTIIIDRADLFGLADLYQLRGRVGRAGHKAFAYLLLPRQLLMAGEARKRISAIKQYTQLGAGFQIAMRDLEIRGAGNLLGTAQSGHIVAVGFDLYCKLLRSAVKKLSGGEEAGRRQCGLRLDFVRWSEGDATGTGTAPAFLPSAYITDPGLRVAAYRKFSEAENPAALRALEEEWRDRFGPLPPAVHNLLLTGLLRFAGGEKSISLIEVKEDKLMLTRRGDYLLVDNRFPRLRAEDPAARLAEILEAVQSLR
jgi:transcription-repair coupling factor (superfamily II helicase)